MVSYEAIGLPNEKIYYIRRYLTTLGLQPRCKNRFQSKRHTEKKEKMEAQKRMAWVAMISMIVFTALVFLPIFPDARIKALSDLFGLFYIGQAGVVGAYMGMTAYMSAKK